MAEARPRAVVCDDRCGCPSPCPGGTACRCVSAEDVSSMEHKLCSCGEHCSCNICTCSKSEVTATGRAFCKCGPGCTCTTCAA
ncbi:metallothionein-like protein 4B [Olea europaea var. sylvestris]|uniref:metallothionein-like protein 4B n=1 Tax=Olea europaea var. sylvestris TaxID=158386 RepID=UPI000C1D4C07|nr:metallothionein-like protein 4B [Olea europaea var. sylvestris]